MTRRSLLIAGLSLAPACAGSVSGLAIRGKLIQTSGQAPSLELPGNVVVALEGDEATLGVLNDKRLAGVDLEANWSLRRPGPFRGRPDSHQGAVRPQGREALRDYVLVRCLLYSDLHSGRVLVLPEVYGP